MHITVPGGVGTVGGVDASRQSPGNDGGHGTDVPLRSVESQDVDRVEWLESELDEGLGHTEYICPVLCIGPLDPDTISLDSQSCAPWHPGHSGRQHGEH